MIKLSEFLPRTEFAIGFLLIILSIFTIANTRNIEHHTCCLPSTCTSLWALSNVQDLQLRPIGDKRICNITSYHTNLIGCPAGTYTELFFSTSCMLSNSGLCDDSRGLTWVYWCGAMGIISAVSILGHALLQALSEGKGSVTPAPLFLTVLASLWGVIAGSLALGFGLDHVTREDSSSFGGYL